MATAAYGGVDIFGPWVSIDHVPRPTAAQISSFFGVSGTFSQTAGTRGRAFLVKGVALANSLGGLRVFEAGFLAFADGIARDLTDPYGKTWPAVIFQGEFQFQGPIGWTPAGPCRAYRAAFTGLI